MVAAVVALVAVAAAPVVVAAVAAVVVVVGQCSSAGVRCTGWSPDLSVVVASRRQSLDTWC